MARKAALTPKVRGPRVFDAAVAGRGGCSCVPGAAGDVVTGSAKARVSALGHDTGLDPSPLAACRKSGEVSQGIAAVFHKRAPSWAGA
ncbi:hypothetical protein [Salibaculum sp.]|uniref:hypothetical protein n=1 Tax=Salibaculum sp. TaxID=2855480 RepID=UPI002B48E67D|nr:hypothetical protein [Salibaculum sp.]